MTNLFDLTCRVAAYMTAQDGRKRFVLCDSSVVAERPYAQHIEIWPHDDQRNCVHGTEVSPCTNDAVARGVVFREKSRKFWRASWHSEFVVSDAEKSNLVIALNEDATCWTDDGCQLVSLSAGMLLTITGLFYVGGVPFVLLEDKDANQFIGHQLTVDEEISWQAAIY